MSEPNSEEIMKYILSHSGGSYGYGNNHTLIAKKVMVELIKAGYAEFILLREDDVNKWWTKLVAEATKAHADHQEKMRLYEIKMKAYEKLSEEDRKTLGVRKPSKPKALAV